jgi:thiol:disulfide interchange protein DsbC
MRRFRTPVFLFLTATIAIATAAIAADDESLADVREKISAMFQELEPQNIDVSPIEGWYTVHKGSIVAYVSADGRYLLQGDLIDLDSQTNLSEKTRTSARRELMSRVADNRVIAFTPADVKYSVTVFTDVDCTYCRKLHSEIDQYLANGIEIRYVLYPRNGPRSKSWNTSRDVYCADNRGFALTAAKLDRSFATQSCDTDIIADNYLLGQDVGLNGTPAIVFEDGSLHAGYMPPDRLTAKLQQLAANP